MNGRDRRRVDGDNPGAGLSADQVYELLQGLDPAIFEAVRSRMLSTLTPAAITEFVRSRSPDSLRVFANNEQCITRLLDISILDQASVNLIRAIVRSWDGFRYSRSQGKWQPQNPPRHGRLAQIRAAGSNNSSANSQVSSEARDFKSPVSSSIDTQSNANVQTGLIGFLTPPGSPAQTSHTLGRTRSPEVVFLGSQRASPTPRSSRQDRKRAPPTPGSKHSASSLRLERKKSRPAPPSITRNPSRLHILGYLPRMRNPQNGLLVQLSRELQAGFSPCTRASEAVQRDTAVRLEGYLHFFNSHYLTARAEQLSQMIMDLSREPTRGDPDAEDLQIIHRYNKGNSPSQSLLHLQATVDLFDRVQSLVFQSRGATRGPGNPVNAVVGQAVRRFAQLEATRSMNGLTQPNEKKWQKAYALGDKLKGLQNKYGHAALFVLPIEEIEKVFPKSLEDQNALNFQAATQFVESRPCLRDFLQDLTRGPGAKLKALLEKPNPTDADRDSFTNTLQAFRQRHRLARPPTQLDVISDRTRTTAWIALRAAFQSPHWEVLPLPGGELVNFQPDALTSLHQGEWLDDNIIFRAIQLAREDGYAIMAPATFRVLPSQTAYWDTEESIAPNGHIIPVHYGNSIQDGSSNGPAGHWVLIHLRRDGSAFTARMYDSSMAGAGSALESAIRSQLRNGLPRNATLAFENVPVNPQQDGSSCGIHVIMNAISIMRNGRPHDMDMGQEETLFARRWLIYMFSDLLNLGRLGEH